MKHNIILKVIAFALIAATMFTLLVACNDGDGEVTTTPEGTTTPEVTTDASTTTEEATTTEAGTTAPPVAQDFAVKNLAWHLGYVGSDTNSSFPEVLNKNGGSYSYSDIIDLGPAGSTITFTDDNTNSNGDTNFASAAAYVFSQWKQEGGDWVLDKEGYKANGTNAEYTDANGARTYTYTSTKDNECVRLCFRSGQSTSFTPASYPEVKVNSTVAPTVKDESTATTTPSETQPQTGTELSVKWNAGYVGSSTNPYGYANKLNPGGGGYSFTDVIELGKKGTKVTFTDTKNGSTSSNAYVVSFWKKNGSEWEIDTDAANVAGADALIVKTTSAGTVYTYVSSKDNECIRFCFRSENVSNAPKIYSSETNEPGTLENIVSEKDKHLAWIEADKSRAFYEILKGKTFTVIGDSYLAGNGLNTDYVWPAILAKKYDMVYNNYGRNGSTMSSFVTTNNPMVVRYAEMVNNNPDIVIIEGGRNDYNKNVPIGEDGSTDTKTMKGAARYLITKVKEKYPNALIICLTVWEVGGSKNSAGNYCSDYGRALIKVCEDMGVPCINAMDSNATGVKMTDSTFRSQYCMGPNDISHLNAEGMKLVFPVFEKYIADFYAAK